MPTPDHPVDNTGWSWEMVSPGERQSMSPATAIDKLHEELKALEKYCTSQISMLQKQVLNEQAACIKRHQEVRELIVKIEAANIDFKRQVTAHSVIVTRLIRKLLDKEPCGGK